MLVISNIPGSNQNLEKTNTKKKQRNHKRHCKKNSDPWRGTQDRLDRGHRSDLSVFLSTFGQASQNIKKHRLQTWRGSEERLDRGHRSKLLFFAVLVCPLGLNLLFFWIFWFVQCFEKLLYIC